MIAFLNLSGGVDSTYYAWRWLRENPKDKILLHHCLYIDARLSEEKAACDRITKYFKDSGLHNFKYEETVFNKGTLRGIVYDVEALSGITGLILKMHPKIKNVLLSYCREETSELDLYVAKNGSITGFNPKHRYSVANHIAETLARRSFNYILYREGRGIMSKEQMIKEMPKELFEMTWYCRKPVNGETCGSCHTCRKIKKIMRNERV